MFVCIPKGFGRNYFSLVAIQAYVSEAKIIADVSSASTLKPCPLRLQINSPPDF